MLTRRIYIIISLCLLNSAVFAQNRQPVLDHEFTTATYHYSIPYSSNWKVFSRGDGVVVFKLQDKQSPGVSINIQTIYTKFGGGEYPDIKALMDDFYSQVPQHFGKVKFLKRDAISVKQPDGSLRVGEQTTLNFSMNGVAYQQWQVMLISRDGRLFQAFAYRSPVAYFNQYQPLAAAMVSSWKIEN